MGITLTDYVIESVLRDGIRDLEDRPELIDDLFSQMNASYLKTEYGAHAIDQIKEYLTGHKLYVVQGFQLTPAKLPCYAINMDRMTEQSPDSLMADYGGNVTQDVTPAPITALFTPDGFDAVLKAIAVPDGVNLSNVLVGQQFLDVDGNQFAITAVTTTVGSQQLFVAIETTVPNVTGAGQVISNVTQELIEFGVAQIREQAVIGVFAQQNPNLTKYLYYLLLYFLYQRKPSLEQRGVQISTVQATDFARYAQETLPEHVYVRYVTFSCLTCFQWNDPAAQAIVGDVGGVGVCVDKDVVVTNSPDRTVNTTE